MKIYENANDQHVRKVVLYEVGAGLAFDKAGTELLTKEEIVDAFLKGCVVENEGNYKTPTGVNVTDSGAELVFGGGGSGGPEVENAIATHGIGWTVSAVGEVVVEETVYTSDDSGKVCTTGLDIETPCVTYPNPGQMLCVCNGVECDVEVGYGHNDEYDENFYSMNITHDGEQVLYLWQLEGNFYVINAITPQPNQTVDFVIYSVDNEVHQIAEKYMPEKVSNAIETGGLGWTESEPKEGFDITWDDDTEGLDVVEELYFKVINNISGVASGADLLGATMIVSPLEGNLEITEDVIETITEDKLITTDNKVYGLMSSLGSCAVFIALEDGTFEGMNFTKGVWFIGLEETLYVSRLYKEASTEEVVHQIDEKYIPSGGSGGAMVVTFEAEGYNLNWDKTVTEVRTAMAQGIPVIGILNDGEAINGAGPCLVDVFSGSIGFIQWINEGELKFFIEGSDDSDDWRLVGM